MMEVIGTFNCQTLRVQEIDTSGNINVYSNSGTKEFKVGTRLVQSGCSISLLLS